MRLLGGLLAIAACGKVNALPDAMPDAAGPQTLTVSTGGSGTVSISSNPTGITCGATCTADFPYGTQVTLHAAVGATTGFSGWMGGGCAGTGDCTIAMTAPVTVTATGCDTSQSQMVAATGAIETKQLVLPAGCTSITIDASGAQGGGVNGGLGAEVKGTVKAPADGTVKVLVGMVGMHNTYGYGGGGGTFVTASDNTPLVIAGGGGGATYADMVSAPGLPGQAGTAGGISGNIMGGDNGNGGPIGFMGNGGCGYRGSGGGGLLTDGDVSGNGGGKSFMNGGAGGTDPMGDSADCVNEGSGGFGGGGAGGNGGGGGGGYSGGPGGTDDSTLGYTGGGGGGSFSADPNATMTAGVRTGNGTVTITSAP